MLSFNSFLVGGFFCHLPNKNRSKSFDKLKVLTFLIQNEKVNFDKNCRQQQFGPHREKTCLGGFANNTDADQPAHPRSLISAFVIRFLEGIICKLATGEI